MKNYKIILGFLVSTLLVVSSFNAHAVKIFPRVGIEIAEMEEAKEKARKEKEEIERSTSRSRSRRKSTRQNPFVKVISSPTVIRSVLGILNKMLR